MPKINTIVPFLVCPDCGGKLSKKTSTLDCSRCKKKCYYRDNFIDLLPSRPTNLHHPYSQNVKKYYVDQFSISSKKIFPTTSSWNDNWQEKNSQYKKFLDDEFIEFSKHFPDRKQVAVDISGGSGYYTQKLATQFKTVIHCDISLEYLQSAQKRIMASQFNNIWFVRADYLRPPFKKKSIDLFISTDSFIYYGVQYDVKVMKQLIRQLAKKGTIIFDVHFRKFYAPYPVIFEYNNQQLEVLKSEFSNLLLIPFWRVPIVLAEIPRIISFTNRLKFLPPVRYIGVLKNKEE